MQEPTPSYLLGALIDDDVPTHLALRIAESYAIARQTMTGEQSRQWLAEMTNRLSQQLDRGVPNTCTTWLAYPSDHMAARYAELAKTHGLKEHHADDSQPIR